MLYKGRVYAMNKKGFTLTEVLGVVIIIVLIALLAMPPILQQLNKSKYELSEASLQVIYHSTENYINHNQFAYHLVGGNIFCISLGTLVESGFLDDDVTKIEAIDDINLARTVKVDVISRTTFDYDLVRSGDCQEINNINVTNSDTSGASVPNLSGGMIPIKWDGNNWVKADYSNPAGANQWYNYDNQEWANAVLVTTDSRNTYKSASPGTQIIESDVLAYLVWIPRYRYQLFNVESAEVPVQEINIEFENRMTSKSSGKIDGEYENEQWLTHPAFTFGSEELTGFWVGKFETSTTTDSDCYISPSTTNCNNSTHIPLIKPRVSSLRYQNVSNQFETARKFNDYNIYGTGISNDAHMMKNTEWGAVAYLTQSKYGKYGNELYDDTEGLEKEVWVNSNELYLTGCAGDTVSASSSDTCNNYETENGVKASTTGNVYGVYDMSGGAWDRVMGNMAEEPGNSGFVILPASKYYNVYDTGTTYNDQSAYDRRLLGDATGEVHGWYGDRNYFLNTGSPWFQRGGFHSNESGPVSSGIFAFNRANGGPTHSYSFRVVMLGS